MSQMKTHFPCLTGLLLALALACAGSDARAAEVSASLSSREAYVGAPVTLTIRVEGVQDENEPAMPEVDGLEFRSLGAPSWSSQVTIINGRRSDSHAVEYAWQVTPQREGTFTIPSITVRADGRNHATDPLRLVAVRSETGDLLFVEVQGQQRRVYVGQPLRLTLKIWLKPYRDRQHDITLSPSNMWDAISLQGSRWGVFADPLQRMLDDRQLPRGKEVLRATSDGQQRAYYLYEVEATLYPRRPGEIDSGDVRVVVQYPTALQPGRDPFERFFDSTFPFPDDPFFSRSALRVSATRPVVAAAEAQPVTVAALPTVGQPDDFRGAVGKYEIVTQATPTSVQAGDPITLNIGIRGDGPMELVQAPPLHQYTKLTEDFKVPDEPLAGIVDRSIKLFSVSIRPRHADVRQIPAIPFSYFDPSTEKYVTIYSDPIRVRVDSAENLSLDSIVAADGRAAPPSETPPVEDGPQLANDASLTVLKSRPPTDYRPLALVLLLPPLAVAGIAVARRGWPRLAGGQRRRAVGRIRAASAPGELHGAVRTVVGAWLSIDHGSALTRAEAVALLQRAGRNAEAAEIDQVLAACERMVYAGGAAAPLDALKQQAQSAVGELWRGGGPPHRDGKHHVRRRRVAVASQSAAAVALLVGAILPACTAQAHDLPATQHVPAAAQDSPAGVLMRLTGQQRERIFAEANEAYQRGQAARATDAAHAKQAFASAAEKYRMLVDAGIRNDRLHVNLGNAYLQSGQRGRATAAYLRALQINPGNRQARKNLRYIQQPSPGLGTEPAAFASVRAWLGHDAARLLPQWVWLTIALGTWVTLWGIVMLWLFRPLVYGRAAVCLLLLIVVVCGTAWGSIEAQRYRRQIVAVDQAVVRTHNGDTFPEVPSSPLPEGTIVELIEDRREWLHVRLDDGTTGWIRAAQSTRL